MGLFDKLKKDIGSAMGNALGDKLIDQFEQATGIDLPGGSNANASGSPAAGGVGSMASSAAGQVAQAAPVAATTPQAAAYAANTAQSRAQLGQLITSQLAGEYQVQAQVGQLGYPIQQLYATAGLYFNPNNVLAPKPYDFALYKEGRKAGYVSISDHGDEAHYNFKLAKAAAQLEGVPFINFYTDKPNEPGYVLERIRRLAV